MPKKYIISRSGQPPPLQQSLAVRSFNKTQAPHFRFYIRNLAADDVEYVEGLCNAEREAVDYSATKETALIWATSCVEDEFAVPAHEEPFHADDIDPVEVSELEDKGLLLSWVIPVTPKEMNHC